MCTYMQDNAFNHKMLAFFNFIFAPHNTFLIRKKKYTRRIWQLFYMIGFFNILSIAVYLCQHSLNFIW